MEPFFGAMNHENKLWLPTELYELLIDAYSKGPFFFFFFLKEQHGTLFCLCYHILFNQSFILEHLDSFQCFAITNNPLVNKPLAYAYILLNFL